MTATIQASMQRPKKIIAAAPAVISTRPFAQWLAQKADSYWADQDHASIHFGQKHLRLPELQV